MRRRGGSRCDPAGPRRKAVTRGGSRAGVTRWRRLRATVYSAAEQENPVAHRRCADYANRAYEAGKEDSRNRPTRFPQRTSPERVGTLSRIGSAILSTGAADECKDRARQERAQHNNTFHEVACRTDVAYY